MAKTRIGSCQVFAGRDKPHGEGAPDERSGALNMGTGPCIQQRRIPFLRSTVVSVAVDVARSASAMALSRVMAQAFR